MNHLTELKNQLQAMELEDRMEIVQLAAAASSDSECCHDDCCGNTDCECPSPPKN